MVSDMVAWALQVYKALRAGVQDVAVKFLHRTNAEDLQKFIEVRVPTAACDPSQRSEQP
jgi:hypothetical protein